MTKRFTIALVALALFVILAVFPVSADYYQVAPNINQSATVFIGESGLNVSGALTTAQGAVFTPPATPSTVIGWWASAASITGTSRTAPTKSIDLSSRINSFTVAPADFVGYTGNWYLVQNGYAATSDAGATTPILVFSVADPTMDLRIWDLNQNVDVTGGSVPRGEFLTFRVDTNMYQAIVGPSANRTPITGLNTNTKSSNPTQTGDGYVDIKVQDESGAILTALYSSSAGVNNFGVAGAQTATPIGAQAVNTSPWFWGSDLFNAINFTATTNFPGQILDPNWSTGVNDINGQPAYPTGVYTIWAESLLNNMKDTYRNAGADYTGKTVSQTYTVTLVSDTVKIEANKDTVVRSKPFSVTVTGRPSTTYHLWVKGTSTLSGKYDDQAPMLALNQAGVHLDDQFQYGLFAAPGDAGVYLFQNGGGLRVIDDVSGNVFKSVPPFSIGANITRNGTLEEANITLSTSGTRTVEFVTTNWTKAQKYTIRVEQVFPIADTYKEIGGQVKSDEVDVNVEKGSVTIVAAGDQSYYLGEEIKFSGTNTETSKTYLFIIGPNLPTNGAEIFSTDPRNNAVADNVENTFQEADVLGDNTWSWKWGTASYALDAGTYTVYAVSGPRDRADLGQVAYGTVSIIIKKPFVSATASQSTVAQGDNVYITGTAEGNPSLGVAVWIMGKNFVSRTTEAVNSDASFSHEVKKDTTKTMYPGQYFVVVQHPMQNGQFDIALSNGAICQGTTVTGCPNNYVVNEQLQNAAGSNQIFQIEGEGALQGSDAAEALVEGINDANVDDTYTKLQFLVETPVIRIDPIGDKHVGDKFTITASTNLAVDDEVLVEVYSSSFKPTDKSQSGEFSGATGTVKVTKGDSGLNEISFDIDSSTFKPDEYLVTETAVLQDATGTALFNVLEGAAPTVAPTVTATAAPTTAAPTTVAPTTVPPTPTPTKSPGYGALIALIGLGAVAFIVVRRH